MSFKKEDSTIVAKELVKELIADITGDDEEWLFGKIPSKNVMIGMIDGDKKEEGVNKGEEYDDRRFESIPSLGLRFKVPKGATKVTFGIKGKLFYRVKPTYDDQLRYLLNKFSKEAKKTLNTANELTSYVNDTYMLNGIALPKMQIMHLYRSKKIEDFGTFDLDLNDIENAVSKINFLLKQELISFIDSIKTDSVLIKPSDRSVLDLLDKNKFDSFINSSSMSAIPNWEIEIYSTITKYDDYQEIILQLVNNSDKAGALKNAYETAIFNGGLIVTSPEPFIPYDLNSLKYDYMDKPTLPALGNNCTVRAEDDALITENIPIYYQKRIVTIDAFADDVLFQALIDSPVSHLTSISKKMEKKLEDYEFQLDIAKKHESKKYVDQFSKEIEEFQHEINRFKYGIKLLEEKSDVRLAFELMNRSFAKGKYKGWRLFQIVFIVSLIADMIHSEYKNTPGYACNDINNVDLIYFSTGGGKTETFLGCVMFSAFFDRIRGKNDGATAIIKYPLRLLAAQQLERVLKLLINANIVKKDYGIGGDDFTVGFFTGGKNTPNNIVDKELERVLNSSQAQLNSDNRQIDVCPLCKSEMNVIFNGNSWKLEHKCSNPACGYVPPIYIVDNEIFRYAPTVVVSTIDKMASIGISPGFRSLFGQVECKCPKHGYIPRGKKCCIQGCNCSPDFELDRKDPIPTLFIQDEMHLVNQSLGTFDSHYESLIEYYCKELVAKKDRKQIKFIGATATISDYDKHIRGLYNKNAKKFPTSVKKENFYSLIDDNDLCRIILGTALYGSSISEAIQKMVTYLRIIVSEWKQNSLNRLPGLKALGFSGGEPELKEILNNYLITIIYNNSKIDAGVVNSMLENQGKNTLTAEDIPPFEVREISGDVDFTEIKRVMHEVEGKYDKYETPNAIVATSAISHGVDEDCFNQIFFFGMPTQTSEYIQAYSRVGRAYTGLVFDVFRLVRDRDKSYLRNFYNYHEYKDLLIDPVPINRYAKNAIYSTLPGIVAALFMQQYGASSYANSVTKLIDDGLITVDTLIADVKEIYSCDEQTSTLYKDIIEHDVRTIFNGFASNTNPEIKISELMAKWSTNNKKPMTSLRDVDISLDMKKE